MVKPRLEKFYEKIVCEDFILLYNFKSISQIPTFERAILNARSKNIVESRLSLLQSFAAFFIVTGHTSIATRARKSIAFFGIREENLLGLKVTLRGKSLFAFLDKLIIFALPKETLTLKRIMAFPTTHNASGFTITQKTPRNFPEIYQFLNFFDFASGFSLLCSLKSSRKSYLSEKLMVKKSRSEIEVFRSKTKRLLLKQPEDLEDIPLVPSNFSRANERKKLLLSAFQFPL